jgi:hypothetical protein
MVGMFFLLAAQQYLKTKNSNENTLKDKVLTWFKEAGKMTMCFCEKHGPQPCEKVSKILYDEFRNGNDLSKNIRDFSFFIEDLEWPFYGLQEEIEQLPEVCVNGDFIIQSEERLNEVLGRITIICIACLKDAINGAPFPVKEGGP